MLRANDLLFIRNVAPNLDRDINDLLSFGVGASVYNADDDQSCVEPDVPTLTLVTLVTRKK